MGYLDEECKGCSGTVRKSQRVTVCTLLPRYKLLECPCLTCLVKVICEDNCELLKDYFIKTYHLRRILNERTQKYERLKYDPE